MPQRKKTRPPKWSSRQILDGIFYQLKNGCNWCDFPTDLPLYSTVFWHYKQWRESGVIENPIYLPKIAILIDHGYHPDKLTVELEKIYPAIL